MRSRSIKLLLVLSLAVVVLVPVAAVASHQFTDVPNSNTFHADIAWLADNGVTKGCNPPANTMYCPEANVTRQQMAAFMHRLAVNKVVDAKTAVNADAVDGFHAGDLARGAGGAGTLNTSTSPTQSGMFTITAPVDGGIVTTLSFNCTSFTGTTNTVWDVDITVDGTIETGLGGLLNFNHAGIAGSVWDSASTSSFSAVTAGAHSIGYKAVKRSGNGSLDCDLTETAVFVPFGADGLTPTASVSKLATGGSER